MTVRITALFGALGLLCMGCDTGDDDDTAAEPLTVITYNAGLAVGFVPGAEDRAPQVSDAVAALDADIVCMQEVWRSDHVDDLVAASATAFPHAYSPTPSQTTDSTPACAEDDIEPLITCVQDNCDVECLDDLVDCMFANCALQFITLEKACMECVQANVGEDVDDLHATCTTEHTHYAYGGAYGTGLLSAHPLSGTETYNLESTTNRRGVLHAVADTPMGALDVYCTHLTAVFSTIPYPREEGSWAEEQAVQIGDLLAYIDSTATTDLRVLLGDMNAGPEVGDCDAEEEENWELLAASGMDVPYVEDVGQCTFCPDNPLQSEDSDTEEKLIDHVMLSGFAGETTSARILDQEITSERCGVEIPAALSDHYGVSVTIEP